MENSLEKFMESFLKIRELNVDMTLSGHGETGGNPFRRVDEILIHHAERLQEMLDVMDSEMNAYEIASRIKWNLRDWKWNIFPKTQKYFALGETIAHLKYLQGKGLVKSIEKDGKIYYKKIH